MSDENNKKDIEVVEGTGNLDISPVYEHLQGHKPKMQNEKPKNIVIPQVKKLVKEEENNNGKDIQENDNEMSIDPSDLDIVDNDIDDDIDDALEDEIDQTDIIDEDDDDSDLTDDIDETDE